MDTKDLLEKASIGFETLKIDQKFKDSAILHLQQWLTQDLYKDYKPQIEHIINSGYWDYLLDCFYQIIPFGTAGRRGEVGIGPNRINLFTIQASAQGHSQYLAKQYGSEAKKRGIVLAYDVRKFFTNKYFNNHIHNPVKNLDCKSLAFGATEVYVANGIKVHMFEDVRTTPELSFAIRHLHCVGGAMMSASHSPPEYNGKKVFDEFGGQLTPPDDEILVSEVTQNTTQIKTEMIDKAIEAGLVVYIGKDIDNAYVKAVTNLSHSHERNIKIVFTPLHGCGTTSVTPVLENAGFKVFIDPKTSNKSGLFENITYNIPNPEVSESFNTTIKYANQVSADIILSADPDADRIGIMVNHNNTWTFLNGNEIAVLLTEYAIQKCDPNLRHTGIVIKTQVTTNLMTEICEFNNVEIIGDLLVGFKYIGHEMNLLVKNRRIDNFLFASEDTHGCISGNYIREKDAALSGLWIAEYAAELKESGKTLVDELDRIFSKYGYYRNYITEIRILGAEGMSQIQKIQESYRVNPPRFLWGYEVIEFEDWLNRTPIVSETDKTSKDGLVFKLKPINNIIKSIKVTIRPSGTEPKIKMYFEIGSKSTDISQLDNIKEITEKILKEIEKSVMGNSCKIIGIDFPERGFLLFWQLPLMVKMKYFEIENELAELKNKYPSPVERKAKLDKLLKFLGSDPIQKIDEAFKAKYQQGVEEYLEL